MSNYSAPPLHLGKIVASVALGALVMYLLDPERGRQRRSAAVDTLRDVGRDASQTVGSAVRELTHRAGAAEVFHASDRACDNDSSSDRQARAPGNVNPRLRQPDGDGSLAPQSLGAIFNKPATGIGAIAEELRKRSWDPTTRKAALWGGGALGLFSLLSSNTRGAPMRMAAGLAGAALLARGATGRPAAGMMPHPGASVVDIEKTIDIAASPELVYDTWLNVEQFPRFMSNLVAVRDLGAGLSHWDVRGPDGTRFEWDSIFTEQSRAHRLSWRTVPGGEVEHRGELQLKAAGAGTRATVRMRYTTPAGVAGQPIARLLGNDPETQLAKDLHRLKALCERGALPHVAAQASTAESRSMH